MRNAVVTKHHLDFEARPWTPLFAELLGTSYMQFRIGTCEGAWSCSSTSYDILAIINSVPGNGHFEDVMQWFSHSCKRDKKDFRFLEIMNPAFFRHLIQVRGFKRQGSHAIKKYKNL